MTDKSPDALVEKIRNAVENYDDNIYAIALKAAKALERLQGELAVERARVTYTVDLLDPIFGEGNNKPVEALVRGVVKALKKAEGERDRLREALEEGVKLYEEIVEECYEYTLEDRPLLSVGIEEWNGKARAALASEKGHD